MTLGRRANDDGFTLIELLVVIVVIGILAGIVGFAVGAFRSDARNGACRADVTTLQTANAAYAVQHDGSGAPDIQALLDGGYIRSTPSSGVTFADGVTNPATVAGCTGELAFTPDPPVSTPSSLRVASVAGQPHSISGDDWMATVTVTVRDQADAAVAGAAVTGMWTDHVSDSGCVTDATGVCSFESAHTTSSESQVVVWKLVTVSKDGSSTDPGTSARLKCTRSGDPCDAAVTI